MTRFINFLGENSDMAFYAAIFIVWYIALETSIHGILQ